jgi:hypothetical protein
MMETVARQVQLARATGARGTTALFLHIGKTAGTTLNSILDREFPSDAIFAVDSHDTASAEAQLDRLSPEKRAQLRLIRGHFVYGVHRVLDQPSLYFSLLRDPCERLISAYAHIRAVPSHRLHRHLVEEQLSFEEFVTSGITLETDNWQLRCLAGDAETPFGRCDQAMLQAAIQNIGRRFAFVGTSERFDDSLLILSRMYGWRHISYIRLNEAKITRAAVTPEVRRKIDAQISLERELYAYATEVLTSVLGNLTGVSMARRLLRWENIGQRGIRRVKRSIRASPR